jgi:hypothetical protein
MTSDNRNHSERLFDMYMLCLAIIAGTKAHLSTEEAESMGYTMYHDKGMVVDTAVQEHAMFIIAQALVTARAALY